MHRYEKTVSHENNGVMLKVFLRNAFAFLPNSAKDKAFRAHDIKINGKRVLENRPLSGGDIVEIYTEAAALMPQIVYDDANICVVNKPAGISSDSTYRDEVSVQTWASEQFPGANICHRLDNQTSGLMIIAKQESVRQEIQELFKKKKIVKVYECLVFGSPEPKEAILSAWLLKNAQEARVTIFKTFKEGTLKIVTEYTTMESGSVSRLKVVLHTGRTHQIRAHLAAIGYPLVGDDVYGDRRANRAMKARKLCLCAVELMIESTGLLSYLNERRFQIKAPF